MLFQGLFEYIAGQPYPARASYSSGRRFREEEEEKERSEKKSNIQPRFFHQLSFPLLIEKLHFVTHRGLVMGSTFWTVVAIFIAANIPFFGIMSLGVSFFQSLLGFLAPVFPAVSVFGDTTMSHCFDVRAYYPT